MSSSHNAPRSEPHLRVADETTREAATMTRMALRIPLNETFAKAMNGNGSALGLRFIMADKIPYEIVGVVENGKYDSLIETPWAGKPSLIRSRKGCP